MSRPDILSPSLRLPNPLGLHMRPAVALSRIATAFRARIVLVCRSERIDAASPLAIVKFGIRQGDDLQVGATGTDAEAAVRALCDFLATGCGDPLPVADAPPEAALPPPVSLALDPANVFLGLTAGTKEEALRITGERLVRAGLADPPYIDAMLDREALLTTFLVQGLAVAHGTAEGQCHVRKSGFVICQFPEGVGFGTAPQGIARLIIGIAARERDHLSLLTRISRTLGDRERLARLGQTRDAADLVAAFGPAADGPGVGLGAGGHPTKWGG
jgi:phosphotransferase system HPr (HPr) family protein